ncbi:flagellin hook IN motif-containing protein [Aporhodopirellula aestuarii]|uniref:Flagellin n=1 Tax=Aporhodopirellula aestuarii TaxID=2950107 RepID=A0ABT0U6I9_9BACT|nr:flagellin hook IN motif-containing protein [Aporhodopirellula aestuarii]MCM2372539.1 hypothetical protein [Aporhodopirellula aestuarii]
MSINPNFSTNAATTQRLQIASVPYTERATKRSTEQSVESVAKSDVAPSLKQLSTVVASLRDRLVTSVRTGESFPQESIDKTLKQVDKLLGSSNNTDDGPKTDARNGHVKQDSDADVLDLSSVNTRSAEGTTLADIEPAKSLGGKVNVAGTHGGLVYTGENGQIRDGALLTLTGELGSSTILVFKQQSLNTVRDSINAKTADTGITATVTGDNLILVSNPPETGNVEVSVSKGTFQTTQRSSDATTGHHDASGSQNDAHAPLTGAILQASKQAVGGLMELGSEQVQEPSEMTSFDALVVTAETLRNLQSLTGEAVTPLGKSPTGMLLDQYA